MNVENALKELDLIYSIPSMNHSFRSQPFVKPEELRRILEAMKDDNAKQQA